MQFDEQVRRRHEWLNLIEHLFTLWILNILTLLHSQKKGYKSLLSLWQYFFFIFFYFFFKEHLYLFFFFYPCRVHISILKVHIST